MDAKQLGSFIQSLRKEQNLTQAQLGQMLNVTDKAISRWERGVGFPDISLLEPLAQALGVTVPELMRSQRIETVSITKEEAGTIMTEAMLLAEEQKRFSLRNRLLKYAAYPAVVLVELFLSALITWYIQDSMWTRMIALTVVYGSGTLVIGLIFYIVNCRYLDPPKKRSPWYYITLIMTITGALILHFCWLLNTDGTRHLYGPVGLAGFALLFCLPIYFVAETCKEAKN